VAGGIWRSAALSVALLTSGLWAAPAAAAEPEAIVVTTTMDVVDGSDGVMSLREAVDEANGRPGEDTVVLAEGARYDLTICSGSVDPPGNDAGALVATESVQLHGGGSTIHQTCLARVLMLLGHAPGRLTLDDLTVSGGRLRDGSEGGGIYVSGDAHLHAVTVSDNHAVECPCEGAKGGGVYASGELRLIGSTIRDNSISRSGGGAAATTIVARDSVVEGNEAGYGGGLHAADWVKLIRTEVRANTALDPHSCVAGGCAQGSGGGVFAPTILAWGSQILGNSTAGSGGGAWANHAEFRDSTIADNRARGLRVVRSNSPSHELRGGGGAGVFAVKGALFVRSTVSGNHLDPQVPVGSSPDGQATGAGVRALDVTLSSSTVSGNLAGTDAYGGGVFAYEHLVATNSTISGNEVVAPGRGGGVATLGGSIRLTHTTIVDNTSAVSANLDLRADARLTTDRSVVGDPQGGGLNCRRTAPTTSWGYNAVGTGGTCGIGAGPRDRVGLADLGLGPLADNGGSTQTHLPIDRTVSIVPKSACTTHVDQRGLSRPQGTRRCEAGSVEVL
jgi:hypothetical protein